MMKYQNHGIQQMVSTINAELILKGTKSCKDWFGEYCRWDYGMKVVSNDYKKVVIQ